MNAHAPELIAQTSSTPTLGLVSFTHSEETENRRDAIAMHDSPLIQIEDNI